MANINDLVFAILENKNQPIKKEETNNYNIDDYKNPPKKDIIGYRKKIIISKDGRRILVTLALIKNKDGKIITKKTSIWKPKLHRQLKGDKKI